VEVRIEELEGDVPVELVVTGFVDDAHSPATKVIEDLVVGNRLTDEGGHDNSCAITQ